MKTRLMIAAVAVLGAGAAYAAGPLKNADTNNDGFVSLDEMKAAHSARIEEHFARVDSNGDGLLSEEERAAAREARREHRKDQRHHRRHMRTNPEQVVEHLDTDGSGSVSFEEFQGRRFSPSAEQFAVADSDGDGELDLTELGEMMAAHRAERAAKRKDRSKD